MLKLINKYKVLILIVFLAAVLRFSGLSYSPPSLNWDEISHGYNAYSILKTGQDEWGKTFPIIFRAYGDYKLPVYIYLTSVSEIIFGLSILGVRFVSVVSGVLIVIFTFLISKEVFKNDIGKKVSRNTALVSALLVAISPWTFHLSRAAFEANLSIAFITGGVYFFLLFVRTNNPRFLILNSIFFGLSVWTYNSARVFVPLFIIFLFIIFRNNLKNFLSARKTVPFIKKGEIDMWLR